MTHFTKTSYFNFVSANLAPSDLDLRIAEDRCPSITMKQFTALNPPLLSKPEALFACFCDLTKSVYHLSVALFLGAPRDFLTLSSKSFLTNLHHVSYDLWDAYAHAAVLYNPEEGTFFYEENLFLRECHFAPKSEKALKENLEFDPTKPLTTSPLIVKKPPIGSKEPSSPFIPKPPPPPGPPTPSDHLKKKPFIKPKGPSVPPKLPIPSTTTTDNVSHLPLKERMKAMKAQLAAQGFGGQPPKSTSHGKSKPTTPTSSVSASFKPKKDQPKVGKLNANGNTQFSALEAMIKEAINRRGNLK